MCCRTLVTSARTLQIRRSVGIGEAEIGSPKIFLEGKTNSSSVEVFPTGWEVKDGEVSVKTEKRPPWLCGSARAGEG